MIRYFLGRELSDRLGVPLARWKRWAREFLPPDPLGGLQSGYARHYSIDQAFTVYLAGHLVSRSKFSIPEARKILSDLEPWFAAEGYRTGTAEDNSGGKGDLSAVREHLILIDCPPFDSGQLPGFAYTIRAITDRRQYTQQGRQIEEEHFLTVRLGSQQSHAGQQEALEQRMVCITRILGVFAGCLELDSHLFAALGHQSGNP